MPLNELGSRQPARIRPAARNRFLWPFLKAQKEQFGDDHRKLIKKIALGQNAPFGEGAVSRIGTKSFIVKTAVKLLCQIDTERKMNPAVVRLLSDDALPQWKNDLLALKPFTAKNWQQWFEVAWSILCERFNGHPERNRRLKKSWPFPRRTFDRQIQRSAIKGRQKNKRLEYSRRYP